MSDKNKVEKLAIPHCAEIRQRMLDAVNSLDVNDNQLFTDIGLISSGVSSGFSVGSGELAKIFSGKDDDELANSVRNVLDDILAHSIAQICYQYIATADSEVSQRKSLNILKHAMNKLENLSDNIPEHVIKI